MKRIIDANLNRATEALRVLEEIARFHLADKETSKELKILRHSLNDFIDQNYAQLLEQRDTVNDVGVNIANPSERTDILSIFKANFKRLQQALRVLAEYSAAEGLEIAVFESTRYKSYTLEKNMFEKLTSNLNKYRLNDKKLYLVTSRNNFDSDDEFLDAVASALKGGVDLVQLREKNANANTIIKLGKRIRELCSIYNAIFIIDDRVDIARIVEADGVHLGQDDIDIHDARHILGKDAIIGISTHCPDDALCAMKNGADYVGVGPVFETPTKPGRKSVGIEYVEWAKANISIPWYAIGGINTQNVGEVINAGASRIAVVREIMNADSPEKVAQAFKNTLDDKILN